MIEKFLHYLSFEKRFSPHTVSSYETDLQQFKTYADRDYNINMDDVNHSMVRSWMADLMDEGLSSRTVNRKLSSLRTFYRFLLREKVISRNPMLKVVAPKQSKRLPVYVEEKAMLTLLDEVEFSDDFSGFRDRLVLEIFYRTGMRLSELMNLKSSDVRSGNVKVLGKRNKERLIPVDKELNNLINEYTKLKSHEFSELEDWLFVTDKGKKLYGKFVYRLVNKYLGETTTLKKKSPHVLRHTFATHMLNNGADLNAIKEILGHANLAATQVYTHNSIEKLKQVHKLAHPRGA